MVTTHTYGFIIPLWKEIPDVITRSGKYTLSCDSILQHSENVAFLECSWSIPGSFGGCGFEAVLGEHAEFPYLH